MSYSNINLDLIDSNDDGTYKDILGKQKLGLKRSRKQSAN